MRSPSFWIGQRSSWGAIGRTVNVSIWLLALLIAAPARPAATLKGEVRLDDVGGSFVPNNCICAAGPQTNPAVVRELDVDATAAADEQAEQNESMNTAWWTLEYVPLPHRVSTPTGWVEEKKVYRGNGWRTIRPRDFVSESLKRRKQPVKNSNWASNISAVKWET